MRAKVMKTNYSSYQRDIRGLLYLFDYTKIVFEITELHGFKEAFSRLVNVAEKNGEFNKKSLFHYKIIVFCRYYRIYELSLVIWHDSNIFSFFKKNESSNIP